MRSDSPQESFPAGEVAALAGCAVKACRPVRGLGYGTNTAKWSVTLADGRRIFVKQALDENAASWLRDERRVYEAVEGSFIPEYVGAHDAAEMVLLAIEDLSDAWWPPPWAEAQILTAQATLDDLHRATPPDDLRRLESLRNRLDGWAAVAADPAPFLSTRLCSANWLERSLLALSEASRNCDLSGDSLVHLDFRSDNACFRRSQMLVVDWNHACVGNGLIDLVFWLPSLALEGGPEPSQLLGDSGGLASLFAGFLAARAGLPPPSTAPTVRDFQRSQLQVALRWAARELQLPPPESGER